MTANAKRSASRARRGPGGTVRVLATALLTSWLFLVASCVCGADAHAAPLASDGDCGHGTRAGASVEPCCHALSVVQSSERVAPPSGALLTHAAATFSACHPSPGHLTRHLVRAWHRPPLPLFLIHSALLI